MVSIHNQKIKTSIHELADEIVFGIASSCMQIMQILKYNKD
jgi:hypothetical protein